MTARPETLWNRQLDLQVRTTLAQDRRLLGSLPEFRRARRILELGSGNGAFLAGIAKAFPDKRFHGVDVSRPLLRTARLRASRLPHVRFSEGDLYRLAGCEGEYDLVIARLVVQHLPDLPRFLDKVTELLAPGGHLLVIEAEDEGITLEPECPLVSRLLGQLRKRQPAGGPAAALRALKRGSASRPLRVVGERVTRHVVKGASRAVVRRLWENLAELVRPVYGLTVGRGELRRQLVRWEATPGSRARFAYRMVLFRKQAGALGLIRRLIPF